MAASTNGGSPFPPVSQGPLHKNTPLAPSQELAYRSKCIELRRRLTEIERSNDETRKRIQRERRAQDKMRLNRAILLNHLKEMMDNGRRLTQDQIRALHDGTKKSVNDGADYTAGKRKNRRSSFMDDDTDGTEEDQVAEPPERPLRSKRANHRGEISMNVSSKADERNESPTASQQQDKSPDQSLHQPSSLPTLAPASTTSTNQNASQPQWNLRTPTHAAPAVSPPPSSVPDGVAGGTSSHSHSHSSNPQQSSQNTQPESYQAPTRPIAPFDRYAEIQRQSLSQSGVAADELQGKIRASWNDVPESEKQEANEQYQEDMQRYERAMDEYKRLKKTSGSNGGGTLANDAL